MIEEEDIVALRKWLVSKLEPLSDADPDILADYVLALLKHELPDDELVTMCTEQLSDFLPDNSSSFVHELIKTINTRSFVGAVDQAPAQSLQSTMVAEPDAMENVAIVDNTNEQDKNYGSYQQQYQREGNNNYGNGNRGNFRGRYQNRRDGGFNNHNNFRQFNNNNNRNNNQFQQPFNNNGFELNGFNGFPPVGSLPMPNNQGFIAPPDGYNPSDAMIFNNNNGNNFNNGNNNNKFRGNNYNRGGGRFNPRNNNNNNNHNNNNNNNNKFSDLSTTHRDSSNTALVVEKLPEDKLSEEKLREYFGEFGNILSLQIHEDLRLAEIEFENHQQANNAWSSPTPIFNNRFIKVYWRKQDPTKHRNRYIQQEEEEVEKPLDIEEARRIQAEKQKEFEEKNAKRKIAEEKLKEIKKKRDEILQKHEEEKRLLEAKINAAKQEESDQAPEKKAVTEALQKQLDTLKSEAQRLGISSGRDSYGSYSYNTTRGRGRGMYRGRGRGYNPYGGYRGRGGFRQALSTYNLDLRPKKVSVGPVDDKGEEALKGYLISRGEFEGVERDSTNPQLVIVSFKDRPAAEQFYNNEVLPLEGDVRKAWYANTESSNVDTVMGDS